MKNSCITLILTGILVLSGCNLFPTGYAQGDSEGQKRKWDGSGYKRTNGVGTGIDPQAREIEKRLGYTPERLF